MRTILLVATVFLSALLTLTGHAQDPSIGLAAHYPLDGNASDASGNGLDGMVFGAVPTTDRFGNASGAFSFSGSDHITTPFVPVYNTGDALTVTVWIESGESALSTYVLGLERSDHQEVTIRVKPDGTVIFVFRDDNHNQGCVASASTVTDGTWHHVTAIRDTDQLRIYIDGVLENIETDVTVVAMNAVQSRDMAIGADNNSTFGFRDPFIGKIDDVRFYNRALSEDEIQLLFSEGTTPPVANVVIDIKPGSDPNSIDCNDDNGTIPVAILSTNDFDATTVNHTTVRFGKTGTEAAEIHTKESTGAPKRHEEDVGGDGDTDLVFHFRFGDTGLACGDEKATLTGETFGGQPIIGSDALNTVGANKSLASEVEADLPVGFALHQNYPNPFNPTTAIQFALPEAEHVRLVVYDVTGREVARPIDQLMRAGTHAATWDASGLPSGVYLYRLTAGAFTETKAMALLK